MSYVPETPLSPRHSRDGWLPWELVEVRGYQRSLGLAQRFPTVPFKLLNSPQSRLRNSMFISHTESWSVLREDALHSCSLDLTHKARKPWHRKLAVPTRAFRPPRKLRAKANGWQKFLSWAGIQKKGPALYDPWQSTPKQRQICWSPEWGHTHMDTHMWTHTYPILSLTQTPAKKEVNYPESPSLLHRYSCLQYLAGHAHCFPTQFLLWTFRSLVFTIRRATPGESVLLPIPSPPLES